MKLQNYASGAWLEGSDDGRELTSAVDSRPIASITSSGIDFAAMLDHAMGRPCAKLVDEGLCDSAD